ncbi:hypothetical protein [Sphingomonas alba]|uniref:Lipocalin-like domain-containing protein n=1 Tax=Sphingomonas alba TaxID=2908208 RepID=A0ABT0RNA0_9SPHN|nr:hypothetical protein [Sphingomonas alba]MCL6684108.1 hypothetical protein [Sphingomonas alba]
MLGLLVLFAAAAPEIPEAQLEWQNGDEEFFPLAFRGRWAPKLADCTGDGVEVFEISATKMWFYEGDSKLIKISNVNYTSSPSGTPAYTINAYTADRELMDLSTGTIRLTLSGGKLYMTRLKAVPEDKQWQHPNVLCPESKAS